MIIDMYGNVHDHHGDVVRCLYRKHLDREAVELLFAAYNRHWPYVPHRMSYRMWFRGYRHMRRTLIIATENADVIH